MSKYTLYPYQQEGVEFITQTKRLIVGDDMGLGKTLQSIASADKVGAKRILVLAPKALLYSWQKEIEKFSDDARTSVITGTAAKKRDAIKAKARWYITNHDTLVSADKFPELLHYWDLIIVDEFHNYMNRKAKKTLAVKKLPCEYFIGLTGTPILTKPDQLWSQLNIIAPKQFASYWNWVNQYCAQKANPFSKHTPIVTGVMNADVFKNMLAPFFIRRTKEEVLTDLPDKIYKPVPLKLNDKQRVLYKSMMVDFTIEEGDEFHKSGTVLEKIIRLRQICLDPRILPEVDIKEKGVKTEALLEIVTSSEEQMVIFTSLKTYANLISKELKVLKISHELLTGDTPQKDRENQLTRFQQGKSRIFVGTIKAGGVGLNLQNASTLIFMDKDFSPAINAQVEARIHRIGQKNVPNIITMYTEGTVDEVMEKMLKERGDMIDSVITATDLYARL